jgi:hypothetical protein
MLCLLFSPHFELFLHVLIGHLGLQSKGVAAQVDAILVLIGT